MLDDYATTEQSYPLPNDSVVVGSKMASQIVSEAGEVGIEMSSSSTSESKLIVIELQSFEKATAITATEQA